MLKKIIGERNAALQMPARTLIKLQESVKLIGRKYSLLTNGAKNLFQATAAHNGVRRYGFNTS